MSTKQEIAQQLDQLNQAELDEMARYLAFLKYRSRISAAPAVDESKLAALYAEFAEEDRELAEEGMADYAAALTREDVR